jgi:hypothetical protein
LAGFEARVNWLGKGGQPCRKDFMFLPPIPLAGATCRNISGENLRSGIGVGKLCMELVRTPRARLQKEGLDSNKSELFGEHGKKGAKNS